MSQTEVAAPTLATSEKPSPGSLPTTPARCYEIVTPEGRQNFL
jgi:hypothetical protein